MFLCGCARSGTTALARLVNMHPQVNVSIEKYQYQFKVADGSFTNKIFEKEEKLIKKKDPTMYIGDKVPGFYQNYSQLFKVFPDSTVFFIYRNIFDVAQSYKNRQADEADDWQKGVRRAVKEWNESLVNTLEFIEKGKDIIPLAYERVFSNKIDFLQYLPETKPNKEFEVYYNQILKHARKLDQNRKNNLTSKDKLWIMNHADFESYRKLYSISHV